MIIGNVLQQLYVFIDSIIVGHFIGKQALAAIGATFPIVFALIALITGLVSGTTVVISQYYGAGNNYQVKKSVETMYVYLFFISLLIPLLGYFFSEELFQLIQLPPNVLPQAILYFTIFIGGSLFLFFFNGTNAILRGLGDSLTPVYFLAISTILNILFDILFVLVFDSGIGGIALATVMAQGIGFVAAFIYLKRKHHLFQINLVRLRFDKTLFRESARIGLPTGLQRTSVALSFLAIVAIVNIFGTDVLAAYSVGARVNSLASMPAMVFSNSLAIFVGQNIGANKLNRTFSGLKATLGMASLLALGISAIVIIFGEHLMHLFVKDEKVIQLGTEYLLIVGSFYVMFSIMFILGGFLRGAGDTFIPMLINIGTLWGLRIPIAYFLSDAIGQTGIWWSFPISWSAAVLLYYVRYQTGQWKTKTVTGTHDMS